MMAFHVSLDKAIPAKSLANVIGRSARIKDSMDECAEELSTVNTVLKERLSTDVRIPEVANALATSESVEGKVQVAADELTQVNQALEDEVKQRQSLEQELTTVKAEEAAARHSASHDPLTGLPNRLLFNDRLEHGIAQAERHGWSLAVIFVDLDNFKSINDTYGHDVGDLVLRTIAQRLKDAMRNDDTVSRLGGDEFLSLLLEISDERDLSAIAEKILGAIKAPIETALTGVANLPPILASIGIAVFPKDARTADGLLKCADVAMYSAKRKGTKYSFARCT